jgi:hypothetical protein
MFVSACWTCGGPQLTRPLFRRRAAHTVTNQTMDKESKSRTVCPGVQHMQDVIEAWGRLNYSPLTSTPKINW